eukprot:1145454-Pelagomonas_calceolata.AAC.1
MSMKLQSKLGGCMTVKTKLAIQQIWCAWGVGLCWDVFNSALAGICSSMTLAKGLRHGCGGVFHYRASALAGWPSCRSDAQPIIGASSFIGWLFCGLGRQGGLVTSEAASSVFMSVVGCGAGLW